MSKFCRNCGAQCADTSTFCLNCGANLDPNAPLPVQSAQPVARPQSDGMKSVRKIATTIMRYGWFLLVGAVVLCLILGVLNGFSTYEVTMTASVEGQSIQQSGKLSELYDADEFIFLALENTAFGLANAAFAVWGILIITGVIRKKFLKAVRPFALACLIASAVHLILFFIAGSGSMTQLGITMKYSVAPHFTAWIAVVYFAFFFAAAKLAKMPRRRKVEQ